MNNKLNKLNDTQFRRKTGVKRNSFNKMVEIVRETEEKRKKILGRPLKLSYEDQVLMALEYLREYRTYFSLAQIYDLSEANCYKICRKVEDILNEPPRPYRRGVLLFEQRSCSSHIVLTLLVYISTDLSFIYSHC